MAFDRPMEADSVDDMGLLSSIIRAPVLGIMWMLGGGGDDSKAESEDCEEEENHVLKHIDSELMGDNNDTDGDRKEQSGCIDRQEDSSDGCQGVNRISSVNDDDDPCPNAAATSQDTLNQGYPNANNGENKSPNWTLHSDSSESDTSKNTNKASRRSQDKDGNESTSSMDPATEGIMNDLVAVMESNHITDQDAKSKEGSPSNGPATMVLSQSKMTSSSTTSLAASYSAGTFSNHQTSNQTLHSSINNGQSSSNPLIRGKDKKMSWSDECGNRSLVEYFEDPPKTSKHWSAMRRNNRRTRHSFDGADMKGGGGTRGRGAEVRVIKSALKRSGSYSPPIAPLYASSGRGQRLTASFSASSSSHSSDSSFPSPGLTSGMKSFKSISVIGSSDESDRSSSDNLSPNNSKSSAHSLDTDDSMAAVTSTKLNATDVQCVPTTLQVGRGQAGGLIIPRGGPSDSRYYFPRGGPNDPRYQLILGTAVPTSAQQAETSEQEEKGEKSTPQDAFPSNNAKGSGSSPNPALVSGRSSPGHHHHFLPRTNGYISPQYGFYVAITPPTPEVYAQHHPTSKQVQQLKQSYQQFQSQNKYKAPSPIPEGAPIPQRFVGKSSVPRPSSNRATQERDQQLPSASRQHSSLKPTFTKNKKGMGMLLAENPHHGVWPTVPFG